MKQIKYGLWSLGLFSLLMVFLYYDPVQSHLTHFVFHSRAYIPYTVTITIVLSICFSITCLYNVFAQRKFVVPGIITSLPIWLYLAWWICSLIRRIFVY